MILYTRRARKDMADLPNKMQSRVAEIVGALDERPNSGTKLRGKLRGMWALRLGRSHRILYEIDGSDIVVLTIKLRRDAYR